jgi:hypothetical protein
MVAAARQDDSPQMTKEIAAHPPRPRRLILILMLQLARQLESSKVMRFPASSFWKALRLYQSRPPTPFKYLFSISNVIA